MYELVHESNVVTVHKQTGQGEGAESGKQNARRNLVYVNVAPQVGRTETDSSAPGLGATGGLRKRRLAVRAQTKINARGSKLLMLKVKSYKNK